MRTRKKIIIVIGAVVILAAIAVSIRYYFINQAKTTQTINANANRDSISDQYKWNLGDLVKNDQEWQTRKTALREKITEFTQYKGKLGQSANMLYSCLKLMSDTDQEYSSLSGYAYQLADEDMQNSQAVAKKQEIDQIGTNLSTASSFIDPEITALDASTINNFYSQLPILKEYTFYIDNTQRLKPHTLSDKEEKIISQASLISSAAYDINDIFKTADMPRPEITLSNGKKVNLDDAAFTMYRSDSNRDIRKSFFEEFYKNYQKYESSFGVELFNQVKSDVFYKNVREYDSSLESALSASNIPVSVYENLIASVNDNLPTLQRYLKLKQKMLGIDKMQYFDLYPSIVKDDDTYSYEQAQGIIQNALKPLGNDYSAGLDKAFGSRWIDIFPNKGKTSGAYSSNSSYSVHPYILMNFMGKYEDVDTLAHELGHTMHSYYSDKNQTYINSQYPIFLAEIASTTNENLLSEYMYKNTTDPKKQLAILSNELDTYRVSIFRETIMAEFEQKIHEKVEQGQSLTGEEMSKMYLELLRKYYGQDKGVINVDDLYGIEWAYIPHFYYNFYVYKYATSMCISTDITERILQSDSSAAQDYINKFLSAGGSNYAINILKNLNIDASSTKLCQNSFDKMNSIMDEIEQILSKNPNVIKNINY